jgi:hypothetical protein
MDAPYFYLVKFWVHPESRKAVLEWLDSGHMADMVALPGFLFVRRVKLEQESDDGWSGFMMIRRRVEGGLTTLFRRTGAGQVRPAAQAIRTSPAHGARVRRGRRGGFGFLRGWLMEQVASITGWTTSCCIPRRSWPR